MAAWGVVRGAAITAERLRSRPASDADRALAVEIITTSAPCSCRILFPVHLGGRAEEPQLPPSSGDLDLGLPTRSTPSRGYSRTERLIEVMRGKSTFDIAGLMHISTISPRSTPSATRILAAASTPAQSRCSSSPGTSTRASTWRRWDARDYTEAQKTQAGSSPAFLARCGRST